MGVLSKIYRRINHFPATYIEKKFDGFLVRIISEKYLSEELIDLIGPVIYDGFIAHHDLEEITDNVLLYINHRYAVILSRIDYGIQIVID